MRTKLVKENIGDILKPKSNEDIIKDLSNLSQKEKNKKLLNASIRGHDELVSLLIKVGADVNTEDNHKYTPLMYASYNGHVKVVDLLKRYGAK